MAILEWQPIETAPKDGKPLLGWVDVRSPHGGVVMMFWHYEASTWELWDDDETEYFHPIDYIEPTHWMPLPDPPEGVK